MTPKQFAEGALSTFFVWTWCGERQGAPFGGPIWKLRPLLLPQDNPRDSLYHTFRWSKTEEAWKHGESGKDRTKMEGGHEAATYYLQNRGYELIGNTAGVDISVETYEPAAPPPARVVKEETHEG